MIQLDNAVERFNKIILKEVGMSRAFLKVSFLPGTEIVEAVLEAQEIAERLQLCYVEFNFNGVEISVRPNVVLEKVYDKYHLALQDRRNSLFY